MPKSEYRRTTIPVDSLQPNPWGLYHVHGNVWEWIEDCWNGTYAGKPTDGSAWTTFNCSRRVARGGGWENSPGTLRSAARIGFTDVPRSADVGFRVARTLSP